MLFRSCVPGSEDDDRTSDFDVIPLSADIAPGKSLEFKIVFRPSQQNFYYCRAVRAAAPHMRHPTLTLARSETL